MDIRTKEASWVTQAASIFKGEKLQTVNSDGSNTKELKQNLTSLFHRRTKIWWNKTTLENYLEKDMVPRGLRVQVFPSYGKEDTEFTAQWELASNNCSKKYLELIIDKNFKTIKDIDGEINEKQDELMKILSEPEREKFHEDLDKSFVIWEKQIKDNKTKKFHRDLQDYEKDRVYKWKSTETSKRIQRMPSYSSVASSDTEHSTTSNMSYGASAKGAGKNQDQQQKILPFRKNTYRKNGNNSYKR
ncbi:uncharacterized protein ACNLHF_015290 [Anomaloglossus baeobatrachus]